MAGGHVRGGLGCEVVELDGGDSLSDRPVASMAADGTDGTVRTW